MYDAILISTHFNYDKDGTPVPAGGADDYDDLSVEIPQGIVYVAQYLHDCGFKVRVVHIPHEMYYLKRFGIWDDQFENLVEKILSNYPAHICGIQVHWYLYCGGAVHIAGLYKKLFPDSKIFLGGYMATACWKEFLNASKDIDGVILGEGEKTFKKIVEKSNSSRDFDLSDIEGLAFRSANQDLICKPPNRRSVLEVDEIPIILPDAAPFNNIRWPNRHSINISRGLCPDNCSYCVANSKEINPRVYQTLKIDKIIEQLHIYQKFGLREIFLGENHFLNTSFMQELIENIIRENPALYFVLETHPVIFEDTQLLEKMIQANFLKYTMGCESGADSLLKRMGRKSTSTQIIGSVRRIVEAGGIVLTSWISNLPGETASEFQQTQELMTTVVKSGGFIYWIENLHVLPGSKLYKHPRRWGIEILVNNLQDWIRWGPPSKRYVAFDEAYEKPLKYLTHLDKNVSPQEMIERFYSNRQLALLLTPEMKLNLKNRFSRLPPEILETEMQVLDWYDAKGWKLWLF